MNDRPRILAVDDDKLIRMNLALALAQEGFEVDTAATCDEARALLRHHAYRLVLTDLDLPDESGFEVIKVAHLLAPDAKVILVTGSSSSLDAPPTAVDGAEAIVLKPFALCDLLEEVRRAIGWAPREGVA